MKSLRVLFPVLLLALFPGALLASDGVTAAESKLLNAEALRYFTFLTREDAHTTFARGTRNEKTYHFTNLRWKTRVATLTQSDRRNGITRKVFASLSCDSSFRVKQNGKWQPWREGGWAIPHTTFRGHLVTDSSGKVHYRRSMASLAKHYSKPRGKGSIIPLRKQ